MARRRIGFDRSAYAFAVAARLADATQIRAVNGLTIGTKLDGIWPLVQVLYPFAGGTALAHSINLKDTGANRITWFGGLTHTALGVQGNGSNAYGNTSLRLDSIGVSFHVAVAYASQAGNTPLFGAATVAGARGCNYYPTHGSGVFLRMGDQSAGAFAGSRPSGLTIASRLGGSDYLDSHNGVTTARSQSFPGHSIEPIALLALNVGGAISGFASSQLRAFSAGSGLTTQQITQLRDRLLTYQEALGRAV
jgi:hypothetical protein